MYLSHRWAFPGKDGRRRRLACLSSRSWHRIELGAILSVTERPMLKSSWTRCEFAGSPGRWRRKAPGLKTRATGPCVGARHACAYSSLIGVPRRFRMRVLRIFLVAAHFPVDRNYRRGNMNCKACQELCRSDLLPRDALSHVHARKPFRIRTCEKRLRNPFGIRSCKIIGLKVS